MHIVHVIYYLKTKEEKGTNQTQGKLLTSKHKNENYQTWSTVRQEEDSEGEYSEEKKSHSERETNVLPVFFLLTQNGSF